MPRKTQKNGSLDIFFSLSNIKDDSSFLVSKNTRLSRYKLNKTSKYVNLLEKSIDHNFKSENGVKEEIFTHLISYIRLYTLDSQINFFRNDIPSELFNDLR